MSNKAEAPETWTTKGLFDHIHDVNEHMADRAFCFVLGAGASVSSRIPVARTLAVKWIDELQRRRDNKYETRSVQEWANAETLGIDGFQYSRIEEFYPEIYNLRFAHDQDQGQASLELIMTRKEVSPSVGYSILAQILAAGRHSVVVTTNFDHLVSDALFLYTTTEPFVVGHEDLISFIRPKMRRPLVAKIHRDLFLGPMNRPEDLSRLRGDWSKALRSLFRQYTPIVIGYGGNDGTFMGLLKEMSPDDISGRMLWCYREKDGLPRQGVLETLGKLGGVLIPILGFDELMLQLGHLLKLPVVAHQLDEVARMRARRLKEQLGKIRKQLLSDEDPDTRRESSSVLEALDEGLERQIEQYSDWWAWDLKASGEPIPSEKTRLYEKAVSKFPRSPELAIGLAHALLYEGKSEEAEKFARRALSLDPRFGHHVARILERSAADMDEVKELFEHAVQNDPKDADVYSDFANFERRRGRSQKAEEYYQLALELNPDHRAALVGYTVLKLNGQKRDEARRYARHAWALGTSHGDCLSAKAALLLGIIASSCGEDDQPALARVKALLNRGYEMPWRETSWDWLPTSFVADDHRKIANAVSETASVSVLDADAKWNEIEPISPDQPWPEETEPEVIEEPYEVCHEIGARD